MIPARGGRIQVLRLTNDLLKQPQLPRAPFTNLTPLLEGGLYSIRRRSLVFVISDFICAPGWERTLNLLNQRHEVLTVRLWDPREIELPDMGMVVMEDAETGDQMFVDTHDRKFRQRFEEAARQREAELAQAFKRAGVDALALSTEEDLVQAIVRFATLRRRQTKVAQVSTMTFIWPVMLFSLVLIPLFIVAYLLMQRRRRKLTASYSSLGFGSGRQRQPARPAPPHSGGVFPSGSDHPGDCPGAPAGSGCPAQTGRHGHPGF